MSTISEHIEKLKLYSQQAYNNYEEDVSKELKQVADLIEELSAKLEAANIGRSSQYYNGGWIPCSSGRLPKHKQNVFVTILLMNNYHVVDTATYHNKIDIVNKYEWDGEGFYIYDSEHGYYKRDDVIAWMPADPYKGVE